MISVLKMCNPSTDYKLIFGRVIVKIVGGDLTEIVPLCASIMHLTLTNPNPVPCCLVVNIGSNISGKSFLAIPLPESLISRIILSSFSSKFIINRQFLMYH